LRQSAGISVRLMRLVSGTSVIARVWRANLKELNQKALDDTARERAAGAASLPFEDIGKPNHDWAPNEPFI
jgi:hypothetical protein